MKNYNIGALHSFWDLERAQRGGVGGGFGSGFVVDWKVHSMNEWRAPINSPRFVI